MKITLLHFIRNDINKSLDYARANNYLIDGHTGQGAQGGHAGQTGAEAAG